MSPAREVAAAPDLSRQGGAMPINYDLVYKPIFRLQAVEAILAPRVGAAIAILALDDTEGIELEGAETLVPVVRVRYADLAAAAIAIEDLDKGTITLNGRAWEIDSAGEAQTPSGLAQGMVMLKLTRAA